MTFKTSSSINKWREIHIKNCQSQGVAEEQFVFEFFPTGNIEYQTVKCLRCGKSHTVFIG